jgi:hypothetical protein
VDKNGWTEMNPLLKRLDKHLTAYRTAIDRLCADRCPSVPDRLRCFAKVQVEVSRLYLDYRLFMQDRSKLEAVATRVRGARHLQWLRHEFDLRKQMEQTLEAWPHWASFEPENAFSQYTGLRTISDYIRSFALHLPEIYEESIRLQKAVAGFLSNRSSQRLVEIELGLQHMGRNHIPFVQSALEWIAAEEQWKDA